MLQTGRAGLDRGRSFIPFHRNGTKDRPLSNRKTLQVYKEI